MNTNIDINRKLSNYYIRVPGTQSSLFLSVLNYELPANYFPRFIVVFDKFLLIYRKYGWRSRLLRPVRRCDLKVG